MRDAPLAPLSSIMSMDIARQDIQYSKFGTFNLAATAPS
ncbi:hypothetical protein CA54_60990 [Symmachiella macrocystis]|uniref:Uncharacterized protein n=1 Tax=Symmachiella macrocystis TaxID=2527985 RepID=A0A5C6AXI6_9PLAN|nr:hypothetical protein CA54_60990 [Symmachiella macrocystis]